jgi:hypothetical protein
MELSMLKLAGHASRTRHMSCRFDCFQSRHWEVHDGSKRANAYEEAASFP